MVRDLAPGDTGKLNQWSLEFLAAASAAAPIELTESPGLKIPDAPSGGIVRSLAATSAATIGSVEVSVDISHTWIGDLRVSVRSPSGTVAILHDGTGGSADNVVKTYTAANAPPLAALAGQPAGGTWQLNVVDTSAQDEGKLNTWKVLIKPSA
jgi:subtilisin-like proprotein convertase family protein